MTKTIAENENNDLFVGSDGNIAFVTGLAATEQLCKAAMETQLSECIFDLSRGVPTRATIFDQYIPAQFEAAGRALLETISGVISVQAFTITREAGVASYEAEIETVYGPLAIGGELNV